MNNFKWTNILKGFGMGTSDLIPGVKWWNNSFTARYL